jgi:thiol:disulfide interchange protein DsbA
VKRLLIAVCLLLTGPLVACAQDGGSATYVEGTHYDRMAAPQRTSQSKIEVVEFFWYGCGHCYTFEPMLTAWKNTLADDVTLQPSPAIWRPPMDLHARAFYAAQALGVLDTLHMALFTAMNQEQKRLGSEQEIAQLFVANGVSATDFNKAWNSFGVGNQVTQAESRARGAKITGTPEMTVAGKYRIGARKAGSQANMLKVADFLIEKERKERAAP